jgi:two-component system, NtrC family, response regulator PilR
VLCEGPTIRPDDLQLCHASAVAPESRAQQLGVGTPLDHYIGELEKTAILEALEKTRWNKTAAARNLGLTFRALRYRLKRLGLE